MAALSIGAARLPLALEVIDYGYGRSPCSARPQPRGYTRPPTGSELIFLSPLMYQMLLYICQTIQSHGLSAIHQKHTPMKKVSTTKGAAAKAAATAKATTKSSAKTAASSASFEKAKTMSQAEARAAKAENKAQAIVALVKGFNFEAQDKAIGVAQKDLFMERTLPLARKMANIEKQIKAVTDKERIAFAEWEPFGVTKKHMETNLVNKYCRVGRGLANATHVKAFEAWCRKENCNATLVNADKYLGGKKPAPKASDSLAKIAVNAKELGTEKGATATKTAKGWDSNLPKAELRNLFLAWAEELK